MSDIIGNAEHMEAMQAGIDQERHDIVSKMSPEERARFAEMEKAVEVLIGIKKPFMLLAAPTDKEGLFWRYQKYTEQEMPLTTEESKALSYRAFHAFMAHASHWSTLHGHSIVLYDREKRPYYVIEDGKETEIKRPE